MPKETTGRKEKRVRAKVRNVQSTKSRTQADVGTPQTADNKGTCPHTCQDGSCPEMNKYGASMKRHRENDSLHERCPTDCPGHGFLQSVVSERKLAEDNEDQRQPTRILFVLRAIAEAPRTVTEAENTIEMSPVYYGHIENVNNGSVMILPGDSEDVKMKKRERLSHRRLQSLTQLCNFDDKKSKILYVEEWVSQRKKLAPKLA